MKPLDRWLQRWRIASAGAWIPAGSRVLDAGCGDGALFRQLSRLGLTGLGLDPKLPSNVDCGGVRLRPGRLPEPILGTGVFDVVTLIAVLEHIPEPELGAVARQCHDVLRPGGRVVLTVPAPAVDRILRVLLALRLVDGMCLEEHHGFDVGRVEPLFTGAGFELLRHRTFQLGLNHLFVFERRGGIAGARALGGVSGS